MRDETDIVVAGAGLAGLSAALTLAHAGFSVVVVAPAPPVTSQDQAGADLRSTAFLQPAKALFEEIGLWPSLVAEAIPLSILRVLDTAGTPPQLRGQFDFLAKDLGEDSFGWNLMNWRVAAALLDQVDQTPCVTLRFGTQVTSVTTRKTGALVQLEDGGTVSARLVVGADGRESAVRQAAGIAARTVHYGQKALAFVVTHPLPHGNASTEIYHEGGPFTLVPLADRDGVPASAVVWMNPGPLARDLAALPADALGPVMSERSLHWLGPLTLASERRVWPIISRRATRLVAERTALIAEAAHVMPPIGAQGLNTSLNDVIALRDAAVRDPARLGEAEMLTQFARRRDIDIRARVATIDLFNRVTRNGSPAAQALRLAGLRAVHGLKPLRLAVMRTGMGGAAAAR